MEDEEFDKYWDEFYPNVPLKRKATRLSEDDSDFDIYIDKNGNIIVNYEKLYPCFDSSDRMNEDRFYRRYIVCANEEEALANFALLKKIMKILMISTIIHRN